MVFTENTVTYKRGSKDTVLTNLTRLLSRLSGAMAPAAASPHSADAASTTVAPQNHNLDEVSFILSVTIYGGQRTMADVTMAICTSPRDRRIDTPQWTSDSGQNLYASVDSLEDGGPQNIYAPQSYRAKDAEKYELILKKKKKNHDLEEILPGFLPQNQFVPVSYAPSPYAQLMEQSRFCAKCGRDAVQDVIGAADHQPREQKNPFSQTERRNPFQHNPFQKGHEDKRRVPYASSRGDMWKEGDEGYGGKIRKEDDQPDAQEKNVHRCAEKIPNTLEMTKMKHFFSVLGSIDGECAWKPGRGSVRNPFSSPPNHSPNQFKGREPRDSGGLWNSKPTEKFYKFSCRMLRQCAWKPGRGSVRNPFSSPPNHSPNQFKGREPRDSEQREKFRKPAPQCPQWEDRHHRVNNNCPLWHPYKMCLFYPNCRSTALDCGYAHPFCSEDECECAEENKDPQLNHWIGPNRTYVD
ncbi:hypothetical protein DICVIV_11274 [Dictyocaulus viviparus]|uniref:Uncharacterized protein n=1 Tax=Dictyocaulus viviparus TaxID=29172 RepID=A0A0D8XDN5_DICVI|nr:hypothetical protein DICVIV_11274 [Dictyocaulus viviparus]